MVQRTTRCRDSVLQYLVVICTGVAGVVKNRPDSGLANHIPKVKRTIGRIDVYQHDPNSRTRKLQQHPLWAACGPNRYSVPSMQAEAHQTASGPLDFVLQLTICPTNLLRA